jgi:hypothetical protein
MLLNDETYISGSFILSHILNVDWSAGDQDIDVYYDTSQSYPLTAFSQDACFGSGQKVSPLVEELNNMGYRKYGCEYNFGMFSKIKVTQPNNIQGIHMDFMRCNIDPRKVIQAFDLNFLKNYYHRGALHITDVDSILCKESPYYDAVNIYASNAGYGDNTESRLLKYTSRGFTILGFIQLVKNKDVIYQ